MSGGFTSGLLQEAITATLEALDAPPFAFREASRLDGRDPFSWAANFYQVKGMDERFGLHIFVLFGLLSVATALSLVSIFLQLRARSQSSVHWFFRSHYHTQSKIPYVVPHPVNVVVVASLLTNLILIIYLSFAYNAYRLHKWARLVRVGSWFPAVWFTFYSAVWLSGYGALYLTYLVPVQFTRRGSLQGIRRYTSPVLLNILAYGVPIMCFASILPYQVEQSQSFRVAMRAGTALNATLNSASEEWRGSRMQTDGDLLIVLNAAQQTTLARDHWHTLYATEMGLWSFWSFLALFVAVPFCIVLVFSTHKRIRTIAATQTPAMHTTSPILNRTSPLLPQISPTSPSVNGIAHPAPLQEIVEHQTSMSDTSCLNDASPTTSFPPSVAQTPAREHTDPPFFPYPSSASLVSGKVSFGEKLPEKGSSVSSSSSPLPSIVKLKLPKNGTYGRQSLQSLRRMSQFAVFPSRIGGPEMGSRPAHLDDLNKRYWHIVAEYTAVLLVMVLLFCFALFELSSGRQRVTDCPRKVLSTIVVTYAYAVLITMWLAYNLVRIYRENKATKESITTSIDFAHRNSDTLKFSNYTLREKKARKSASHVQFGGKDSDGESTNPNPGLNIDMSTVDGDGLRPSICEFARQNSYDRRRSSYRAASMDLTEALAFGPGEFHRRCSIEK